MGGEVGGDQGGCEWRSKSFVKITKKKNYYFFFLGGGSEWIFTSEAFVKIFPPQVQDGCHAPIWLKPVKNLL